MKIWKSKQVPREQFSLEKRLEAILENPTAHIVSNECGVLDLDS